MLKKATLLSGLSMMLTACVPYQPTLPPSQWDQNFVQSYENSSLSMKCFWVRETLKQQPNLAIKERMSLITDLREHGLTSRDVELIFPIEGPKDQIGTNMSFAGLTCLGAKLVNQSYYPRQGHTWQLQVGSSFVYMRGDGTENNMRVYSWN